MRRVVAALLALGATTSVTQARPLLEPVVGEAFFGDVTAVAPAGATTAVFSSRHVVSAQIPASPITRGTVSGRPGPRGVTVLFTTADGRAVAKREVDDAYLLPASGRVAAPGRRRSIRMERALARIAAHHGGVSGLWAQRLWDGRAAGWNAEAEFPAASLVKLPLGVGAIMRMGPTPWAHASWPDLTAALRASDNTAANALVQALGSGCGTTADAAAAEGIRRLGGRHTTFTGCYQQGEELQPHLPAATAADAPTWSNRHTTARDMARMLYALQAAAVPTPAGRRQTGIPSLKARLLLGLLLTSIQDGPNATLFGGGLPPGTPIAEKNGWRQGEQHGAAIAYTRRGPIIVVVLTQRAGGASTDDARAIGAQVARVALRG